MTGRLQPNTDYTVTHLYGTDVLKTDAGADDLFIAQAVGLVPGDFNGALAGRVDPFLRPRSCSAPSAGRATARSSTFT